MFPSELQPQVQDVLVRLDNVTGLLLTEVDGLATRLIEFKPEPAEWSIKEVVCHLCDVDRIFRERAERMLEEDEPFLRGFNPDELAEENGYRRQIWDEAVADWRKLRNNNLIFFKSLKIIQWMKRAIHQERGPIGMLDVASALVSQSETHLAQIRHNKKLAL